jgi:hypothetical protein
LRHACSESVDPTASFENAQKECVSAATQFILTVRYRRRLTPSVAQFFRRARPGILVAPAFGIDCPGRAVSPESPACVRAISQIGESTAPVGRFMLVFGGASWRAHATSRSLQLTRGGELALVGADENTGIDSNGLLIGPDGDPPSRQPPLGDQELQARAEASVLSAVRPGSFFSETEKLQAAVATWLAGGRQVMVRCLVDTGAGSIFLTPKTAAKAGVGHSTVGRTLRSAARNSGRI